MKTPPGNRRRFCLGDTPQPDAAQLPAASRAPDGDLDWLRPDFHSPGGASAELKTGPCFCSGGPSQRCPDRP